MTTQYQDRIAGIWSTASVREAGRRYEAILGDVSLDEQAGQITSQQAAAIRRAAVQEHDAHVPVMMAH
jgi:hypothetical protein